MPEGSQIWVLGVGVESNSTINTYRATLNIRISQSLTVKTTIPEAKMYVDGDCSTQDERLGVDWLRAALWPS